MTAHSYHSSNLSLIALETMRLLVQISINSEDHGKVYTLYQKFIIV